LDETDWRKYRAMLLRGIDVTVYDRHLGIKQLNKQ